MVNPDIDGYKKWVASVIRQHHSSLKTAKTVWLAFKDTDGDIIAIVPQLSLEFKDGADYAQDIMRDRDAVYSSQLSDGDTLEVNIVSKESSE